MNVKMLAFLFSNSEITGMQDTAEIHCPYCGEPNEIYIDLSGGENQAYVEDCQVCCQPWEIIVDLSLEEPAVSVRSSND